MAPQEPKQDGKTVQDSKTLVGLAKDGVDVGGGITADPAIANASLSIDADRERIRRLREKQPFGAFDKKLDLPPIQGYKLHWFNDRPGRVERALSAGWTHILDETGKPKTQIVGGDGLKAYALKIPEEFWLQDVKRNEQRAQAQLAAVKKKPSQSGQAVQANDRVAFYTPNESGEAVSETHIVR